MESHTKTLYPNLESCDTKTVLLQCILWTEGTLCKPWPCLQNDQSLALAPPDMLRSVRKSPNIRH